MKLTTRAHPITGRNHTSIQLRLWMAMTVALILMGAIGPAIAQTTAPDQDLEAKVAAENEQLQRLQEQLEALENLESHKPLPETPVIEPSAPEEPRASAKEVREIPSAPLPGAEEAFADTLYALGEYERARAVYQQIIDSEPPQKVATWASIQLGNCARRQGDYTTALNAYESIMTQAPESLWAEEAAWWVEQIKWRLLWQQLLNPDQVGTPPAAT